MNKPYILGTQKKRLGETVLQSTLKAYAYANEVWYNMHKMTSIFSPLIAKSQ